MQVPPPPPGPQAQQPLPTPVSPYQPAAGFQQSALSYSFHRWLMLGIILVLASVIFVEVVAMDGAPAAVDYDMEAEGALAQEQMGHDSKSWFLAGQYSRPKNII